MAVAEYGWQRRVLDARGNKHWALPRQRIVVDVRRKSHALERRHHFLVEVAVQLRQGLRQLLAFRLVGDASCQVALKYAAFDVAAGPFDGTAAAA